MGDTESCSSRPVNFPPSQSRRHQRQKVEVYHEVLCRLKESNDKEATLPGFEDELWTHFCRLPTRYAMDVKAERARDVIMHKRLLQLAHNPATRPAIEVRLVQVDSVLDGHSSDSIELDSSRKMKFQCSDYPRKRSINPPPAFASLPDLEDKEGNMVVNLPCSRLMHEITISTNDKPKLLSQLTSLLSEIGLNIQEAHAFSTVDGYSLDVFVVDNWAPEETEELKNVLSKEIPKIEKNSHLESHAILPVLEKELTGINLLSKHVNLPSDQNDVWEIDASQLNFGKRIASGSCGDLYRGTFCNQDVAIKVLSSEHLNDKVWREFTQEVFIMRKVRHKNVVQFVGACTSPSSLCIVTEFMSGGSMYDFLHKQKGSFNLQTLLRVVTDISKGMHCLHQNNIIHRDLKAANLLMDENGVVKVADFGVARVQDQSGVMTAETGTYRWMAPEVIEHRPYDHKADVFSFGLVLWELLTGKLPYDNLTPLQAAVGVVQQGLRPSIPRQIHPKLAELLERCWEQDPCLRPEFSEILELLEELDKMVGEGTEKLEREVS